MTVNDKIFEQLMAVRDSGACNMLSKNEVQRQAFERGFFDLVCFIEEHPKEYVHFILTGEMPTE